MASQDKKVYELPEENSPQLTDHLILDRHNVAGYPMRVLLSSIASLLQTSGFFSGGVVVTSGITAAGNDQATATILTNTTNSYNRVDTVASGQGVKNGSTAVVGDIMVVQNTGQNELKWYPFGSDSFYLPDLGSLGGSIAYPIAPGNSAKFVCYNNGVLTLAP